MHNCISWIHFKRQFSDASHLCMHPIIHSKTLNSPVPQVSENSQWLLVRTQSWRSSNSPTPKFWWDTTRDWQLYQLFFLHHSTESVSDECTKCMSLTHFGVACFLFSLTTALYLLLLHPFWWLTLLRKDRGLWGGSRMPSFVPQKKAVVQVNYGSRSASSPGGLERGHIIPCHFVFNSLPSLVFEFQPLLELWSALLGRTLMQCGECTV